MRDWREIDRDLIEKPRRYDRRVRELYSGWLPYRLAAKWETRAYWRARMQAWDEVYAADASPETLELRSKWGRLVT